MTEQDRLDLELGRAVRKLAKRHGRLFIRSMPNGHTSAFFKRPGKNNRFLAGGDTIDAAILAALVIQP